MRRAALAVAGALRLPGGHLLLAVDDRLEVRTGPELGHRRLGDPDGGPGGRVAGGTGGPHCLLEHTEAGDRDLVTLATVNWIVSRSALTASVAAFLLPS